MYATLREFVEALERAGELRRITAPVSPILEIAAIADRVSRLPASNLPSASAKRSDPRFHGLGGPALLFENVKGSDVPVLINAFGSYRRMEMALGCEAGGFEAIAETIAGLVRPRPPRSLGEAVARLREFAPLLRIPPKRLPAGRRARCQEIVRTGDGIDLTRLPMIRCWPHDGDYEALGYPSGINDGIPGAETSPAWKEQFRGRYITFAGVHTIHADDAGSVKPSSHNIGMYRVQVLGPRTMAMHWHVHHDGAAHWRSWKRLGRPMPVAIALGGESVLPYAATAPLPPGISELLMAGFLNGRGIPLVPCKTVPLHVPANAEIVIEGFVSTEAGEAGWDPRTTSEPLGPGAAFEGPFGDHTGFYSLPDRYPLLTVTAVTHARDPVYPATIVGPPPQEDYYLGKATERLFLPLLRVLIPDVEDYDLPMFGAFHNCAFVKIRKQYPLHARRVMHAIWGAGQMAWTKTIFVVDEDVDVHDASAVLRACAERCDPALDIETVRGPLDILDHAAPVLGGGTKMGFDCTRTWPGERLTAHATFEPSAQTEGTPRGREPGAISRLSRQPDASRDTHESETSSQTEVAASRDSRLVPLAIPGLLAASHPPELGGWLFLSTDRTTPADIDEIARAAAEATRAPYIAILGPDIGITDFDNDKFDIMMFHLLANADMGRDSAIRRTTDNLPCRVFDATPKSAGIRRNLPVRPWPPMQRFDEATLELIERRWEEYAID